MRGIVFTDDRAPVEQITDQLVLSYIQQHSPLLTTHKTVMYCSRGSKSMSLYGFGQCSANFSYALQHSLPTMYDKRAVYGIGENGIVEIANPTGS